jgi:site-specific DNA-methyltransferase (adenine-specific)
MIQKKRAPRNRTLTCSAEQMRTFKKKLLKLTAPAKPENIKNRIINQDFFQAAQYLPENFVDLLIIDPPYNLTKNYHGHLFRASQADQYSNWFDSAIRKLMPALKKKCSVYVCSDWKTSTLIFPILDKYFKVLNRITWEREKGRGAKTNWKNNSEDIWFCTTASDHYFNVEAVKLKRKVIAPYRTKKGQPKDWHQNSSEKFRLTHPSNFWSDITIPFWSMPENTDHPTQKPEKLIAKLILASSRPEDFIMDPFAGSGTTPVVAVKTNRCFVGIEQNEKYCCWAIKRIQNARKDPSIQGYADNVFWERNTFNKPCGTSTKKP